MGTARHVVSRPGSGGVAHTSTNFSEWIQPASDTARMSLDSSFTINPPITPANAEINEQEADEPGPETYPDDINALATMLMGGFDGVPAGGVGASFAHDSWRMIGSPMAGDDDPFSYVHTYRGSRGGTAVSPHALVSDLQWTEMWRPSVWPAGAVGYEVETVDLAFAWENPTTGIDEYGTVSWPLAEPMSCDLTVSLQTATGIGDNGGSIGGLVVRAAVSEEWGDGSVVYRSAAGATYFEVEGTKPGQLNGKSTYGSLEHTVISQGVEPAATEYQFTVSDFAAAPPHSGLFGLYVGMTSNGGDVSVLVGSDGSVQSSDGLTYTGTYTIRPPRFRWIFETTEPIPPVLPPAVRRTYPRDDALAGGSAPRTWPPSKASQSSNRTFGGYL